MQSAPRRLLDLRYSRPEPLEVLSGALLLVWGVVLLLPPPTFGTSPGYAFMARLAPEGLWAVGALLLGLLQIGGMLYERLALRIAASGLALWFWSSIAAAIFLANPGSTGGPVYTVLAAASLVTLWRLGKPL